MFVIGDAVDDLDSINFGNAVHKFSLHNVVLTSMLRKLVEEQFFLSEENLNGQTISNIVWSLTKCFVHHNPKKKTAEGTHILKGNIPRKQLVSVMDLALARISQMLSKKSSELVAKHHADPNVAEASKLFGGLKPQELSNLVWSLAKADFFMDEVEKTKSRARLQILFEIFERVIQSNWLGFNSQELSNMLWGFGKLFEKASWEASVDRDERMSLPEGLIKDGLRKATKHVERFKKSELINILWTSATYLPKNDLNLLKSVLNDAVNSNLTEFGDDVQICGGETKYLSDYLGGRVFEDQADNASATKTIQRDSDGTGKTNAPRGLPENDGILSELFEFVCEELSKVSSVPEPQAQVMMGYVCCVVNKKAELLSCGKTEDACPPAHDWRLGPIMKCPRAWKRAIVQQHGDRAQAPSSSKQVISQLHANVAQYLPEGLELEVVVENLMSVDILLKRKGVPVVVEVDGDSHFWEDEQGLRHLNGTSLFRNALLLGFSYVPLSVQKHEWQQLEDGEKEKFLSKRIKKAVHRFKENTSKESIEPSIKVKEGSYQEGNQEGKIQKQSKKGNINQEVDKKTERPCMVVDESVGSEVEKKTKKKRKRPSSAEPNAPGEDADETTQAPQEGPVTSSTKKKKRKKE